MARRSGRVAHLCRPATCTPAPLAASPPYRTHSKRLSAEDQLLLHTATDDDEPWAFLSWNKARRAFNAPNMRAKLEQNRAWVEASASVCDAVRVCDSSNRLDTLSLHGELLDNLPAVRAMLEQASCGRFLAQQSSRHAACNDSNASPAWFTALGMYPLGTMVAAKLEIAIWKVRVPCWSSRALVCMHGQWCARAAWGWACHVRCGLPHIERV